MLTLCINGLVLVFENLLGECIETDSIPPNQ